MIIQTELFVHFLEPLQERKKLSLFYCICAKDSGYK
jgi:hypothetical protein